MWPESSSVNIVNLVKKNLLQFRRYRIFPRGLFFLLAHPVERCPRPLEQSPCEPTNCFYARTSPVALVRRDVFCVDYK